MKENVLDVLMYLFDAYVDAEEDPEPDQHELRLELSKAGFGDAEIDQPVAGVGRAGAVGGDRRGGSEGAPGT